MNIDIKTKKDTLLVRVDGRVDGSNYAELENSLKDNIEGINVIEFDFKKLAYISSAGLRVMLWVYKEVSKTGGYVVIKHISENVMSVFELSGFSDFFIFK